MARRKKTLITLLAMSWGETDDPPTEFRIFGVGINDSEKGQFLFDDEAAGSVMREYQAHGKPLLFDYNHGTMYEEPTPEQAVSAGEFTPEVRPDGLWATAIKWTAEAFDYIKARKYRLFSPAFEHEEDSGRITRLINCALTNLPALNHIAPLMAASMNKRLLSAAATTDEGDTMEEDMKRLRAELAAKTEECAMLKAKLSAFEEKDPEKMSAVALRVSLLRLTKASKDEEALGQIEGLQKDKEKLAAEVGEFRARELATLTAEIKTLLDDASDPAKSPKIIPAERPGLEEAIAAMAPQKAVTWLRSYLSQRTPHPAGLRPKEMKKNDDNTEVSRSVMTVLRISPDIWNGDKPPTALNDKNA